MAIRKANEVLRTEMAADTEGDLWVFHRGLWRYLTDDGTLSADDGKEELPEQYEPYLVLSETAEEVLRGWVS